MKLHWLQHIPFEGLGCIREWAATLSAEITCTRLFAGDTLPAIDDFDLLVIMGGPMGAQDHTDHPWLIPEKQFIRKAIHSNKRVLGICLGAQLIADALNAKVFTGPQKEIGWYPILREQHTPDLIPDGLIAFHWHGDTFDIPTGAVRLASSEACINQGFVYDNRVVALQFHLETTDETMEALIKHCEHELIDAPYIQSAEQMRNQAVHLKSANRVMRTLLDQLIS
jgi:GMP synthase-like glutamine amidotransferase